MIPRIACYNRWLISYPTKDTFTFKDGTQALIEADVLPLYICTRQKKVATNMIKLQFRHHLPTFCGYQSWAWKIFKIETWLPN